jgi:hypothetical protein
MADEIASGRATWIAIGIVTLGVVAVTVLSGHSGLASDGGNRQQLIAVMSSAARRSDAKPFRGAEMSALMGSCSLDLTAAEMAPGEEATLDIMAMMGSVTIRVPDGWTIDTRAVPVMGGIRDDRWRARRLASDTPPTGEPPRLVLRGFVMMGSIFIKS